MTKAVNRKIYLTLMTALTVSGFIVICTLGQSLHRQKVASRISFSTPEIMPAEIVVREYNGRIGVFKGDSASPYRVIDYDVSLLFDLDREQLSEGVVMENDETLRRFIEDIAT